MRVIDLIQILQANGIPLEIEVCVENRSGVITEVKDIAVTDKPSIPFNSNNVPPGRKCIVLKGNHSGIIIP